MLAGPGQPQPFPVQQNQQGGGRNRRRRRGRGRDRDDRRGGQPGNAQSGGSGQHRHGGQGPHAGNHNQNAGHGQQNRGPRRDFAPQQPSPVVSQAAQPVAPAQFAHADVTPAIISSDAAAPVDAVEVNPVLIPQPLEGVDVAAVAPEVSAAAVTPSPDAATGAAQPQQQSRNQNRHSNRNWRDSSVTSSSVSPQQAPSNVRKIVLLNASEPGEIRVAILENGELAEIFMERKSRGQQAGNIYKGRVVNVEPSLQAAFVDLGCERNGFLHASDVIPPDGGYGDVLQKAPRKERDDRRGGRGDRNDRGGNRDSGRFQQQPPAAAALVEDAGPSIALLNDATPEVSAAQPDTASTDHTLAPPEGLLAPVAPVQTFKDDSLARPLELNTPAGSGSQPQGTEVQNGAAGPGGQGQGQNGGRRRRRRRGGRGRSGRGRLPGAAPMLAPQNPALPNAPKPEHAENNPGEPYAEAPADAGLAPQERSALELIELRAESHEGVNTSYSPSITQAMPTVVDPVPLGESPPDYARQTTVIVPSPITPEASTAIVPAAETVVASEAADEDEEEDNSFGEDVADTAQSDEREDSDEQDSQNEASADASSAPIAPVAEDVVSSQSVDDGENEGEGQDGGVEGENQPSDAANGSLEQIESNGAPVSVEADTGEVPVANGNEVVVENGAPVEGQVTDATAPKPAQQQRPQRQGGRQGRDDRGRGHERRYLVQEMLREGQEVLIQVAKEGIGQKGPALTTYISIPGRYLVLMPAVQRMGVSKRIESEEQRRNLKDALAQLNPPDDMGVIVRTAGMGRSKEELQRDMEYLTGVWNSLKAKAKNTKGPALIYQEGDVVTRVFRDVITDDVAEIVVDDPIVLERAREFLKQTAPGTENRLKLYQEREPIFHRYGVEQQMQRLFNRKVNMKSGGSIVIEQTEALVAIDVNTGRFREKRNQDDTILQTNLEAAREIARQLRLRDIGGLVMIDFIDMEIPEHKRRVERELKAHLARDKARINVLPVSPLGVVEMTRQRVRHSLRKSLFNTCPHCSGSGHIKSQESMGLEMLRELKNQLRDPSAKRMKVLLNSGVAFAILNQFRKDIARMEEQYGVSIEICGDPAVFLSQMHVSTAKEGGDWVLKKISEVDDYVRNS